MENTQGVPRKTPCDKLIMTIFVCSEVGESAEALMACSDLWLTNTEKRIHNQINSSYRNLPVLCQIYTCSSIKSKSHKSPENQVGFFKGLSRVADF